MEVVLRAFDTGMFHCFVLQISEVYLYPSVETYFPPPPCLEELQVYGRDHWTNAIVVLVPPETREMGEVRGFDCGRGMDDKLPNDCGTWR